MGSSGNLIGLCERKKFMFYTFINFEPVQRLENRRYVRGHSDSRSKRVVDMFYF